MSNRLTTAVSYIRGQYRKLVPRSNTASVRSGRGGLLPLFGIILYFGTDKTNTWWGIHTHTVGGWLIVASLAVYAVLMAILLVLLAIVAIAGTSSRSRRF